MQVFLRRYRFFFLFLAVCTAYFLWRYSEFLVWDDTSSTSNNLYGNNLYYNLLHPNFFSKTLKEIFAHLQGDGYRPISAFIRIFGVAYYSQPDHSLLPFILLNAVVWGLTSVAFVQFASHFLSSKFAIALAAILFFLSTPVLSASYVLFSGIQMLVPLLLCTGLNAYFAFKKTLLPSKRRWLAFLLGAIFLFGPWFREFVGMLPVLILFLEWESPSRSRGMILGSTVGFLHALFPTLLLKVLLFSTLPFLPVWKIGNLANYMQAPRPLNWRIFLDITSLFPPLAICMFVFFWIFKWGSRNLSEAFKDLRFLLFFFAISFLPFLKLFNEQVHLGYSLLPLSILVAKAMEDLIRASARNKLLRISLGLLLGIVISDHVVNLYAAWKVPQQLYSAIRDQAAWFREHLPPSSIVVTNVHHGEDIRFYSKGHIEPWGFPGGIPNRNHWLFNMDQLRELIAKHPQTIYFLDARIANREGQRAVGRDSPFTRTSELNLVEIRPPLVLSVQYPFFDPVRYLLPLTNEKWPGPPDLEFDIYRGPALNGKPFLKEVGLTYHLYALKGSLSQLRNIEPPPVAR